MVSTTSSVRAAPINSAICFRASTSPCIEVMRWKTSGRASASSAMSFAALRTGNGLDPYEPNGW